MNNAEQHDSKPDLEKKSPASRPVLVPPPKLESVDPPTSKRRRVQPPAGPEAPPSAPPHPTPTRRRTPPMWALLLIFVGGCLLIAALGTILIQAFQGLDLPSGGAQPTGGAENVAIEKLPTFLSPPTIPAELSVLQENGTPLLTVSPNLLNISGRDFQVVPVNPEQGRWPVPQERQDLGVWIHGTVINYVVGLPYTQTTDALLRGLTSSDRITLSLNNGTALVFGSPEPQDIDDADLSPLDQNTPGITIVLLESRANTRLMVRARYLPEESFAAEGVQYIAELKVQVLRSGVLQELDDTRDFVIEYSITNESAASVDTSFFDMTLEDNDGQRYSLHDEATATGEYGAQKVSIDPGATVLASAGYRVPQTMQPPITWIFRADPTSDEALRYILPYEAPLPTPAKPDIALSSAFFDAKRDVIVIEGSLRNEGETPLNVSIDDVALRSDSGNSSLRASTPLLPWTVAEGETKNFELQFSRPANTDSVLLDILGFTFEIEGLP